MSSIIESLSEKVFDSFKKITPALVSVALLSGFILFLPEAVLIKISLNDLPDLWKRIIGRQIYFVNQVLEYIVHNGVMKDLSVLQEPPFTDQGSVVEIFTDLSVWFGIRNIIDRVNANAVAA